MRRLVVFGRIWVIVLLGLAVLGVPAQASTTPGRNGKILFGQVFPNFGVTINPNGSGAHRIGPPDSTSCVKWSPDSSKVLCNVWSPQGVPQPATANPNGSDFKLLNPNLPFDLFCLSWSPEGTRLLCHSEGLANPATAGLYTARSSDAGDLVRVTATPPGGSSDVSYGYSPDGSRILFARLNNNGSDNRLFSVEPNGRGMLRLSPPTLSVIDLGFFDRVGADWSPDGTRVAFAAAERSNNGEVTTALFVVSADGTGLRQITPPGLGAISAQWSPNGRLIAFTSCCSDPEAWVVHPNGTGLRQVTSSLDRAIAQTPVWSPNSRKLLFNRQRVNGQTSLWTVNINGSEPFKLADTVHPAELDWGTASPEPMDTRADRRRFRIGLKAAVREQMVEMTAFTNHRPPEVVPARVEV